MDGGLGGLGFLDPFIHGILAAIFVATVRGAYGAGNPGVRQRAHMVSAAARYEERRCDGRRGELL